jgi:hypothetical protein
MGYLQFLTYDLIVLNIVFTLMRLFCFTLIKYNAIYVDDFQLQDKTRYSGLL